MKFLVAMTFDTGKKLTKEFDSPLERACFLRNISTWVADNFFDCELEGLMLLEEEEIDDHPPEGEGHWYVGEGSAVE